VHDFRTTLTSILHSTLYFKFIVYIVYKYNIYAVEPVKQDLKGKYIDKLESNKRIKQIAKSMEPDPEEETEDETDEEERTRTPRTPRTTRTRTPRDDKTHNMSKFPLWKEKTSWSEYEPMIHWHRRTSKKDDENQFMDLVNALIESDKEEMAKRLMQNFKNHAKL